MSKPLNLLQVCIGGLIVEVYKWNSQGIYLWLSLAGPANVKEKGAQCLADLFVTCIPMEINKVEMIFYLTCLKGNSQGMYQW